MRREVPERKEEEAGERERCGKCGVKLREARVIPKCRECGKKFHVRCAEVTRAELEGEVSEGRWRCGKCTERAGNGRRGSNEEEGAEESKKEGKKQEWGRGAEQTLRVLQWNADGVWCKKAELEELLVRRKVGVAMVQESKLGEKSKTPVFEGYTVVRKDRVVIRRGEEMKGGGLLTLIRKDLPFGWLHGWKGESTEGLSVAVDLNRKERVVLTNVCRPRSAGLRERMREWRLV